jgi:hypothetical protein
MTRVDLTFDKIRDCLPESAVISLKDPNGVSRSVFLDWKAPFELGNGIHASVTWEMPADIPKGTMLTGNVIVRHNKCKDGKDPSEPAVMAFEGLRVM